MGSGALWWLCLAALGSLLVCLMGQSAGAAAQGPGLDKCSEFQNPKNLTCKRCKKGWSGPYCTRENIAYVRAAKESKKRINDEDVNKCGAMKGKKQLWLTNEKSLTNDMMIDIHLNDTDTSGKTQQKFNSCSVADCAGEKVGLSDVVLRWKCMASEQRNSKNLTVQCNDKEKVAICEIRVYQCTEGWWDLENGCNQSCRCQDGVNCNPWNGTCLPGKEIQVTTASSSSASTEQPSSTLTTLSSSPTPTTLSSSATPTTRSSSATPTTRSSSPTPTTLSSSPTPTTLSPTPTPTIRSLSTTPTTLSSSPTPTTLSSSPTPTTLSSSPTPTTLSPSPTPTTLSSSTTPTTRSSSSSSSAMTDREEEVVTTTLVVATTEEETSEAPTSTLTDETKTSSPSAATTPVKSSMTPGGEDSENQDGKGEKRMASSTFRTLRTNEGGGSRGARKGSGALTDALVAMGAIVVLVALAVVAGIIYKRKQGQGRTERGDNDDNACVVDMEMNNRTPASHDDGEENEYANTLEPFSVTTDPVAITAFRDHMARMKMCGGYSKEFQELPRGIQGPVIAATEAANESVKKNRFKDILPYDDSRVVLKKEKDSDSDYINASYIDGFDQAVAYIAAQGPLAETVGDFWHMVWAEGCSKIVMLTNLCEGNKIKCEQYWPNEEGGCETFGDYAVTCVKVVKKAHFVHRCLSVAKQSTEQGGENQSPGPNREVQHMHFTAWPDHGVPCPVALVRFWASVVMLPVQLGGPMLVHCSAGIGRTGTFIALDMLTRQAETTAKVSVFPTVRRLRRQRVNMVQVVSQYVFLHEVVREWLCSREGDLIRSDLLHGSRWKAEEGGSPSTQLPAAARQQCAAQFQLLEELRPVLGSEETTTAQREENVNKNRSPHILPVEQFRVCLAKSDQSDSDYINAAFLPSLSSAHCYIVTQLPLSNTVADFWRMVRDWRVRTVVRFLDAPQDQVSLYPERGQTIQHGAVSITTSAVTTVRPGLSLHILHLQETRSGKSWSREVSVYCVDSQQAIALRATKVFVTLANVLLPLVEDVDPVPPIVLQCLDGAGLSCVLCAVLMGIESLQQEERTSPFLLARLVHTARPLAFTTPEQYEFMVRCLLHHTRGITEEWEADTAPDHQQQESGPSNTDNIYANV